MVCLMIYIFMYLGLFISVTYIYSYIYTYIICPINSWSDMEAYKGVSKIAEYSLKFGDTEKKIVDALLENNIKIYENNRYKLETIDPHALYPTSIYRTSKGYIINTENSLNIESIMHLSITTSIKIEKNVLLPSNKLLRDIYKPYGRCIIIIDNYVDKIYSKDIENYFGRNNIVLNKLGFNSMEANKHINSVELILNKLKEYGVKRNEAILIVGGGVISDIAGFATALYHRNTPYIMLCTSIVSGIDAGPSPRTCCDGFGYKNIFGAYHPPILTITDRNFFKTLKKGWIRHGIAEIIKMAVVKDVTLFDLLEKYGNKLVHTKFGTVNMDENIDTEFDKDCDVIIGKALESYVKSEYNNLWETHQCRPHAYGHTWTPGYELKAGLLHGHAVATGMGYNAYLAFYKKYITQEQLHRILSLISNMELSLWHNIMNNHEYLWNAQVKIIQKRGGNLVAPVPKDKIGLCGYINNLTKNEIKSTLQEYKNICGKYKRNGLGIEPHCHDVGLENPNNIKTKNDDNLVLIQELKKQLKQANDKINDLQNKLNSK